jgi:hypothetical protein
MAYLARHNSIKQAHKQPCAVQKLPSLDQMVVIVKRKGRSTPRAGISFQTRCTAANTHIHWHQLGERWFVLVLQVMMVGVRPGLGVVSSST